MQNRNPYFRPLHSFSKHSTNHYLQRLIRHRAVLDVVRSVLPDNLAKHAVDCVLKERKLVLYTGASAWASQLRFYSPSMLKTINAETAETLDLIHIKILQPSTVLAKKNQRYATIPSANSIALIEKNIRCTPDGRLKEALKNLNDKFKQLHMTGGRD